MLHPPHSSPCSLSFSSYGNQPFIHSSILLIRPVVPVMLVDCFEALNRQLKAGNWTNAPVHSVWAIDPVRSITKLQPYGMCVCVCVTHSTAVVVVFYFIVAILLNCIWIIYYFYSIADVVKLLSISQFAIFILVFIVLRSQWYAKIKPYTHAYVGHLENSLH